MKGKEKTVLVVAAHPDDEVLGVGGTMAKHASQGDAVYVLILTDGASAQYPDDYERISRLKREQSLKVAEMLGAKDVFTGDFEDMKLDAVPVLDVNRFVSGVVARVKPNIIYTHHFSELNSDHRVAYEATTVAVRPFALPSFEKLLCYPVDTLWHWGNGTPQYNSYADISDTLEVKLQAMAIYDTEVRAYPHPRSLEALRHTAHRNGAQVGLKAAEIFQLVLEVNR